MYDLKHIGGGPRHVFDLAEKLGEPGTGVTPTKAPVSRVTPASVRALAAEARRYDLVHTHAGRSGVAGRLAAAMAGVPAIHTWHGFHPERWSVGRHVLERVLRRHTAAFIHVSRSQALHGLRHGFHGTWVLNGVRSVPLPRRIEPAHGQEVLSVGRWDDPVKGADILVRAWNLVPETRLLMLGPKPSFDVGNRWVWLLGSGNPADFYGLAAVYVAASWAEGCPYAVLDAMAAGLPVVATRVRGHADLVVDRSTGLLVPPGDPPALAKAIRSLLYDPDRARQMGRAGAERAALHFTMDQMARGVMGVYREVLDESS